MEVVDLYQGVDGGTGGGYYLKVIVFFTSAFVFCSFMPSVSFFLSDQSIRAAVYDSVLIICFLFLCYLQLGVTGTLKVLCLSCKTIYEVSVSSYYSVDFLRKE